MDTCHMQHSASNLQPATTPHQPCCLHVGGVGPKPLPTPCLKTTHETGLNAQPESAAYTRSLCLATLV
jgi:hypothetical protein